MATAEGEDVMRIGKWIVRVEGWALVFETPNGYDPASDSIKRGHDYFMFPSRIVELNEHLNKLYSAEDIKRWRNELHDHMGGL